MSRNTIILVLVVSCGVLVTILSKSDQPNKDQVATRDMDRRQSAKRKASIPAAAEIEEKEVGLPSQSEKEKKASSPVQPGLDQAMRDALAAAQKAAQSVTSDLKLRAKKNGIPVDLQREIDNERDPRGSIYTVGHNFDKYHKKHDLSYALLEKLKNNPYVGIGVDIGMLPHQGVLNIDAEIVRLALSANAAVEYDPEIQYSEISRLHKTRKQAIVALGEISTSKVSKNGTYYGRTGSESMVPNNADVRPSEINFFDELSAIAKNSSYAREFRICAVTYLVRNKQKEAMQILETMLEEKISEEERYTIRKLIQKFRS